MQSTTEPALGGGPGAGSASAFPPAPSSPGACLSVRAWQPLRVWGRRSRAWCDPCFEVSPPLLEASLREGHGAAGFKMDTGLQCRPRSKLSAPVPGEAGSAAEPKSSVGLRPGDPEASRLPCRSEPYSFLPLISASPESAPSDSRARQPAVFRAVRLFEEAFGFQVNAAHLGPKYSRKEDLWSGLVSVQVNSPSRWDVSSECDTASLCF